MREPAWRRTGKMPDYRFSLANERTFLAWVRIILCMVLALIGAVLAVVSYRRWAHQEQAMRNDEELPHSWLMLGMTIVVSLAAIVFAVLIMVRP